jgi:hypothetical protein
MSNRLLLAAIASEVVLLLVFVGVPPVARLLGGGWPTPGGWVLAAGAIVVLLAVDTAHKAARSFVPRLRADRH